MKYNIISTKKGGVKNKTGVKMLQCFSVGYVIVLLGLSLYLGIFPGSLQEMGRQNVADFTLLILFAGIGGIFLNLVILLLSKSLRSLAVILIILCIIAILITAFFYIYSSQPFAGGGSKAART